MWAAAQVTLRDAMIIGLNQSRKDSSQTDIDRKVFTWGWRDGLIVQG